MSAFTTGPWKFCPADDTPGYREPAAVEIDGRRWACTASVFIAEETDANARLIAAAPDLYEALEEAWEYFDNHSDTVDGDDGIPIANEEMRLAGIIEAALAKVEEGQ